MKVTLLLHTSLGSHQILSE